MIMVFIDSLFYTKHQQNKVNQDIEENLDNKHCDQSQNDISNSESPPPYTEVVNNSRLLDK